MKKVVDDSAPVEVSTPVTPIVATVDKRIQKPGKYEITKDTTFKITFWICQKEGGRWVVQNAADKGNKNVEEHWVEFRMWSFDEEIEIRKVATSYDPMKKLHLVDHDMMNRFKVQRLMKAWSFSQQNDRLKLLHVNGVLSDESYNVFRMLQPSIARYIIDRMNDVLEYSD